MSKSSAAIALRESFGDRKLPDISRKITACVSCRKLKIKCHMNDSGPPCTRCKTRGLSCTVNKSLQMLLESDASWKEQMERRIDQLEKALWQASNQNLNLSKGHTDLTYAGSMATRSMTRNPETETPSTQPVSEASEGATLNLSCSLGAFPASSVTNLTVATERPDYRPDLISCGVIPLETAEECFNFYQQSLDPCVYNVLTENDTLADIRARSSLLTAAICTVSAFCSSSEYYRPCSKAFKDEVSIKLFSEKYEFDDVRALCIGAFWLRDVSSALNGLAVRIATQLDLHRCITKMPHAQKACHDRTRLYFLVFVCDHHCSLVHGRPPMTREMRLLKSPGAFLQSKFSNRTDLKLISQVELWSINRDVFDHFGADIESAIVSQRSADMERFNNTYDRWYQTWLDAFVLKDHRDSFYRCVFDLYFHFAKLYLFSHVFRGRSLENVKLSLVSRQSGDLAHYALENASSIVKCIVDNSEAPQWLERLPFYCGTMVAFASVCLIRSVQEQLINDVDPNETLEYLRRLVEVLRTSSTADSPTRTLLSISKGLEMVTKKRRQPSHEGFDEMNEGDLHNTSLDFDIFSSDAFNLDYPTDNDEWMSFPDELGLQLPDPRQF